GGVRLRKWVETEPVQEDVELRQERAYVEREPINQQVSDAEIGEQEIEVPLVQEEAVVEKQTVAKERVRVGKEVDTRTETVGEELRKERIDIDGDGAEERTEDRT
ncbi:MAG: YsnF/AvaK domain-containing protein, partial [Actinobacteria bacterium]|nr:YsnF/AvaK domain-containing protein [Actinomycetota bacterium]